MDTQKGDKDKDAKAGEMEERKPEDGHGDQTKKKQPGKSG